MIYLEDISLTKHNQMIHSYHVNEESERLLGHLSEAETGNRGFLLSNNTDYLSPYNSAVNDTRKSLLQLVALTQATPSQQKQLTQIDILISDYLQILDESIQLYKNGSTQGALQLVLSDKGKILADELRNQIAIFNQTQSNLLKIQRENYQLIQSTILLTFILGTILFILFIIVFSWSFRKKILTPLTSLTNSAKKFRLYTNFEPVEITNKDEIGDLAHAYNSMGKSIHDSARHILSSHQKALTERDDALYHAITDSLTGLKNRKYFNLEIQNHIQESHRYENPLSILILDIDFFKKINDTYGHNVGDDVLHVLGKMLQKETRAGDMAVRYGGEEFVIVLTNTDVARAELKAEQLRNITENLLIPELDGKRITISVGVTELRKSDERIDTFIDRADKALYQAKESGRNKVCSL